MSPTTKNICKNESKYKSGTDSQVKCQAHKSESNQRPSMYPTDKSKLIEKLWLEKETNDN